MLRALLLSFTIFFGALAWGGGDLPFPLDNETSMPVLQKAAWDVTGTNLVVQLKRYLDPTNSDVRWIRIWIRGNDGFVWQRIQLKQNGNFVDTQLHIDGITGSLKLRFDRLSDGVLVMDGIGYRLNSRAVAP